MIQTRKAEAPATGAAEARAFLNETARAVRVMKASWLRVAINLKRIRDEDLWRHSKTPCDSFSEYVHGVLQINRGVARRMLEAVGYTEIRRPQLLAEFEAGNEDLHVPSYDVLDQLRRAQDAFHGRDDDFAELESRVYDDGVGRVTLKREIEELLDEDEDATPAAKQSPPAKAALPDVIARLKEIEEDLLGLEVPKEARRLLFQLVELLEKEQAKTGATS